ncbi:BamA/TamA family outer membrane protein [Lutimonas halocynthiae]|uniref:translocation and assembly module lipoprotein TamL n=1 Tax=Lutimonas halocynthiae TaxID=1446477 RepID=UPI0025B56EC2|nr:BamA/TamA family outer membrane protein [Lutimonas halocynthiae]MDN3641332.1 BamA/TamA family outer membrane protein [Lutimonas halocynthiae]
MPSSFTKILLLVLILMQLVSCNSIKYVQENENLLKENVVLINGEKNKEPKIDSYLAQKPNRRALGMPLSLYFYNFGDPDFDMTFDEWIANHPKKYDRYESIFSKKQTFIIYNNKKSVNNWFLNKGESPVIFDDSKARSSANTLKDYFISVGFFEAEVDYSTREVGEKELAVDYNVNTNNQYYVDSVSTEIESPVLDSLYIQNRANSFIKKGKPFVFEDFEKEESRLVTLFRNSGVYHFTNYSMGFWTDSIKKTYKKDVLLKIPNRLVTKNDTLIKEPYKAQVVKRVNVYTDFSVKNRGKKIKDSASYNGYNFYSFDKMKFKPKYLVNSLFITPDGLYKDSEKAQTQNYIRNLRTFSSSVDISYLENEDESLTADIYLNPLKKYAITVDLDATTSNIKPFGVLGKFSFLGRNMFKGSEIMELTFQGSFFNLANDASNSDNFFNGWEVLTGASLRFPRILFPFNTSNIIPKYMAPTTNFDASLSFQKNVGLDRQTTTAGMAYNWKSSKKVGHRFDLFNASYIKNQNIDNYFPIYDSEYQKLNDVSESVYGLSLPDNEAGNNDFFIGFIDTFLDDPTNEEEYPDDYDTVSDVDERRSILIEDSFVPIIGYSFIYNTRENVNDNNFSHFTTRVVSSGTFTSLVFQNKNEFGQRTFLDVPVAQYFKVEFEYKKYWELRDQNILVFRTFVGAAIPYGNSSNVPFSRSYSAGGSNEMRAWRTFDLGPGGELNNLEYKVGTFKVIGNIEYRFKLTNKFNSALFIDAGNIWDITDSNLITEEGKFTSLSSLKYTAVGSGFGLRYDFGFLVFRFDIGFKTYEPYLPSGNRWFVNYNFGNAVYNIGINYPF